MGILEHLRRFDKQQSSPPTDTGSQTETSSQAEPHISLDSSVDPSPPTPPQDSTAPPAAHTGPPPPCAQPVAEEQRLQQGRKPPKTAILIDSNGKFLNHREVFPRHSVGKFWCPHTDKALQLLCHTHLGDPDNIVIHTGTNDLRYMGEKVAEAVVKVARKAHREFPRANITISTLLPRTDFPVT
ncbi:hypothetical protein AAFF_G00027960 [Aldrovandia affinis]|uniref:Uncharacterized protein n=1 Tax=Aldrovandia affinis TaxID=143900 RepID=A0AAD7S4X0_9TELE|nr:hypothetical protein AAFF_G00027960 [Aldrovandia affinis]